MNIKFSKEELLKLLSEYYSNMFGKKICVKDDIAIKYIDGIAHINLKLFYEEDTQNMKIIKIINENDICNFLEHYADKHNLIFIYFKYLGTIRHTGYYVEEDSPIFEGICANFEERKKKLIKK